MKTNLKTVKIELLKKELDRRGPRILHLDIETAPILASVWGLWDQNVGLNMIERHTHLMSWSAKWYGEKEIFYEDQRNEKDISNDKRILKILWNLLDQADYVVAHNGKRFDIKKINSRFILNGMSPPSAYKVIDTLTISKKHFAFDSNKLEYLTDKLCVKYKKQKHGKYSGFELWKQCMDGNMLAWKEMEKYNKYDVLSLEELYNKLMVWETSIDFSNHYSDGIHHCSCGSTNVRPIGFAYLAKKKVQRYQCHDCGKKSQGTVDHNTPAKKQGLKR